MYLQKLYHIFFPNVTTNTVREQLRRDKVPTAFFSSERDSRSSYIIWLVSDTFQRCLFSYSKIIFCGKVKWLDFFSNVRNGDVSPKWFSGHYTSCPRIKSFVSLKNVYGQVNITDILNIIFIFLIKFP